jgi:hypothetical protein
LIISHGWSLLFMFVFIGSFFFLDDDGGEGFLFVGVFLLDDDDGEDLLIVVGVVLDILNVADMLLISLLFERSEYYTVIGLLYPLLLWLVYCCTVSSILMKEM